MDSPPTTADAQYSYPSPHWNRSNSTPAVPRLGSISSPPPDSLYSPASQVDFFPVLIPQQSLYHAQLLQYNKLIAPSRGGGLQTPPLQPLVSSQNAHVGPRSRSNSKVSNKDSRAKKGPANCHGNRGTQNPNEGDRGLITGKETPAKMPPKKLESSHPQPPRTGASASSSHIASQSSSVPSTPHQHARKFSFESREPSPNANQSHSPRSAYSETNGSVPSLRPLPPRQGGCRYETALERQRRRIPYSIGSDRLEKVDSKTIKSKLTEDEERKLTTDMRELYDRLQPTEAVEEKRKKLVQKLEKLLNTTWPGHDIRVHLFGSSGNLLCSDDSDVDICIVTPWKELEGVCMLADLLAKNGMEKVVCVSSAKVPIVKIWDPELKLACDMNVNNTLALENTRMIRTYVEIDERVRPLAMIIKHWTRRRILNDAALGNTLSSYTWICMIIAFLQLRQPPVIPSLHEHKHLRLPKSSGEKSWFADDVEKLRASLSTKNKSTLGELLFQFFRFYAHEFDYTDHALSIRLGKLITKKEKKWNLGINNQLCVEEPFNTSRNLGNTADEYSFRGIHLELRRAFDLIAQGKLEECCEQYVFPKEEEKIWQKPPQAPRPILLRSASQQQTNRGGGRGGHSRGGRQQGQHRNSNQNNRRASSVAYDTSASPMFYPPGYGLPMNPQDAMYMQQNPELLAQTLSALQFQENSLQNNLRFIQYTQSQALATQQAIAHAQRMQGGMTQGSSSSTERSRTNSFDLPPLTAPVRSDTQMYYYPMPFPPAQGFYPQSTFTSYPSSPASGHAADFRRGSHRSTAASDPGNAIPGSSLRSQSQPASRSVPVVQSPPNGAELPDGTVPNMPVRHANPNVSIPSFIPDESTEIDQDNAHKNPPQEDDKFYGFYLDPSTPRPNGAFNGMPAFGDIGPQGASPSQGRRRLSTDQFPQFLNKPHTSRSPSPSSFGHSRAYSVGMNPNSAPLLSAPFSNHGNLHPSRESPPVVVNGSSSKPQTSNNSRVPSFGDTSVAEESDVEDALHINLNMKNGVSNSESTSPRSQGPPSGQPMVVNGSTGSAPHHPPENMNSQPNGALPYFPGLDFSANYANPVVSPPMYIPPSALVNGLDLQLSPVQESHSPSPTVSRRIDFGDVQSQPRVRTGPWAPKKESKVESPKTKQKSPTDSPSPRTETAPTLPNPRVNGLSRENGHVRGARSESDHPITGGGWQKIPKGRKKAGEPKSKAEVFPQSEQAPKDDSERKGG